MSTAECTPMHLPRHLPPRSYARVFVCALDGNCVLLSCVFLPILYGLQRRRSFESVMFAAPPPVSARESARRWAAVGGGANAARVLGRRMREQRGIVIAGNQYIVK